jgi:hypothetical protein
MDPPVHFAIRGEILSGNHELLAILPQRGRNPLCAGIAGEDEIRDKGRDWFFAANLARRWNGSYVHPSRFVPRQSHFQFSRP